MKTFVQSAATLNQIEASRPPAMIRPAEEVKDLKWWTAHLSRLAQNASNSVIEYRKGLKQFKESKIWEKDYKGRWQQCCREQLHLSHQRVNELIRELNTEYYEEAATPLAAKTQLAEIDERRKQWESTHNTNATTPAPDRPEAPVNPPKPAPKSTFCAADFPEEEDKASVVAEAKPETIEVEVKCPKCDGTGKITKTVATEASEPQLHYLWKAGIPEPEKLTAAFVGYVIGRLRKNDGKLPKDLDYLRNKGEREERQWRGAPKQ